MKRTGLLCAVALGAFALLAPAVAQPPAPTPPAATPIVVVTVGPGAPQAPSPATETPTPPPTPTPTPTLRPTPLVALPRQSRGRHEPSPSPSPSPDETPEPAGAPSSSLPPSPIPTLSPTPGPLRPEGLESSDNTDGLIGGLWQCTTFGGTSLTHVYSRGDDATSIVVDTTFMFPDHRTGKVTERYQFHSATNTWTAPLANNTITASAPVWSGDTWTFTGEARVHGKRQQSRMVYTRLGDNSFRRDFEQPGRNGGWDVYAGETCRRPI